MAQPKSNRLNDYTRKELEKGLAEYLNKQVNKPTKCRECKTEFMQKRRWQEFCSVNCKSKWHAEAKERYIQGLEFTVELQRREIEELRQQLYNPKPDDPLDPFEEMELLLK